jgi:glutaredoxin 3
LQPLVTDASNDGSIDMVVHELDKRPDGKYIQQVITQQTGRSTVPQVYVRGQHVGGNDDTQAAHRSGKLAKMLLGSE